MKKLIICTILAVSAVCQAEVPKLLTQKAFTSASLAEAVNHYVALGEAGTFKELDVFIVEDATHTNWLFNRGYSVNERIAWIFRVLYAPKEISMRVPKTGELIPGITEPLRAPEFGTLSIPEKTMPLENWPLYPVALSGSTYVVLKDRYAPKGVPETIQHYMDYCKDNGIFRTTPVPVPTREEALKDAKQLRQSAAWKAIEWVDTEGVSFPLGEQWTWGFINSQVKTIADAPLAGRMPKPDSSALTLR